MDRLFISHVHDDEDAAARIVSYLEGRGVPCWISSRDIPPQAIYADAITQAMQASAACVVLITAAANQSKAMKRELELASHYDKPFIPIKVDGSEPAAGFDYYLRNTQWVDYAGDGDQALDRIVATVKGSPTVPRDAPASAPALASARRRSPAFPAIIAAVVAIAAAAVWIAWPGGGQPAATEVVTEEAAASDADVMPLIGSYHWDGLDCGDGPMVTLEDAALVFTMAGTPTVRHTVLSAEPDTGGYALRVETRVLEPEANEGEMYVLNLHEDMMNLDVITGGETNSWQRCPD